MKIETSPAFLPHLKTSSPVAKAAREFEAQLLASLLESTVKSFSCMPGGDNAGSEGYGSLGIQALSTGLAEAGGVGIARILEQALDGTKVPGSHLPKVPLSLPPRGISTLFSKT